MRGYWPSIYINTGKRTDKFISIIINQRKPWNKKKNWRLIINILLALLLHVTQLQIFSNRNFWNHAQFEVHAFDQNAQDKGDLYPRPTPVKFQTLDQTGVRS